MDPDGNDDPESFFQKLNNLYQLQTEIDQIVLQSSQEGRRFILAEETIKALHRIALHKLLREAGEYRKVAVALRGSPYVPPSWIEVPALMRTLCEYVNENWTTKDLIHLSAFCLWRLNWIHPFRNGNGRTARAICYLVLCARHGGLLPAKNTVAQQIVANKVAYNESLRRADTIYAATQDVTAALIDVERLLTRLLIGQLKSST